MVIIKYENESEAKAITDEQIAKGMHIVAVSNVKEGNFLGFDDRTIAPPVAITPVADPTIAALGDNQITLMDVLATMCEAMTTKGTM